MSFLKIELVALLAVLAVTVAFVLDLMGLKIPNLSNVGKRAKIAVATVGAVAFLGLLYLQASTGRDVTGHLACALFKCRDQPETVAPVSGGSDPGQGGHPQSVEACIRQLKREYSCDSFMEYVSRSNTLLFSSDPRHMTFDQPIELAAATAQSKLLVGGYSERCRIYEDSIAESCRTLANIARSDLAPQ